MFKSRWVGRAPPWGVRCDLEQVRVERGERGGAGSEVLMAPGCGVERWYVEAMRVVLGGKREAGRQGGQSGRIELD